MFQKNALPELILVGLWRYYRLMTWAEGVKGSTIPIHNLRPRSYFHESVTRTHLEIEGMLHFMFIAGNRPRTTWQTGNLKGHVDNMASQGTHRCAVFQKQVRWEGQAGPHTTPRITCSILFSEIIKKRSGNHWSKMPIRTGDCTRLKQHGLAGFDFKLIESLHTQIGT